MGIGTKTPASTLDVQVSANGSKTVAYFLNTSQTSDASQIRVGSGTANKNNMVIGFETDENDDGTSGAGDGNYGYIGMNSVGNAIFINKDANVGIGTASPSRILHAKDSGYSRPCVRIQAATGNTSGRWTGIEFSGEDANNQAGIFVESMASNSYSRFNMHFCLQQTAGTQDADITDSVLTIANDGTFSNASGSADVSDRELKENINPIENGLETINQLQGKTFTWKESASLIEGTKYGLIAQELEEVLPDLVYDKCGIRKKEDGTYYKSVLMNGLIPVLVEAVKELSAKVEALENA
jgi:hypothetical protein